ncbi:MAG: glutathione S-transferase N-terminal domain-containing protein [Pseudomonadota bacterium]
MPDKIILYCGNKNYSSWSLRAWLALRKAGADFDERMVWLGGETSPEELQQISPNGKVPAIEFHGQRFSESIAICELAAELNPSLMLTTAVEQLWCRSISAEMHSGFMTIRTKMPMNCRNSGRRIGRDDQIGPRSGAHHGDLAQCPHSP